METLLQDIRYGVRTLAKNPGFMIVAIITLALGIGVNTAIFSMVDAFLLRPLPVNNPSQITVLAFQQQHQRQQTQFSTADYRDIQQQTSGVFSDVFGYVFGMDGLGVDGKADRIMTNYVSGNYFAALGIKPALGRFILPSEGDVLNADPVMVLSYAYWQTQFGADPQIVGRKVSVDGHPVTIVGVAPKGFEGVYPILKVQGYLPLGMIAIEGQPSDFMTNRQLRGMPVLARLRPGASLAQAQAALAVVSQRLSQDHPDSDKDMSVLAYPELRARPNPDPNNTVLTVGGSVPRTCGNGAAACLRERCEYSAGARHRPRTRNGHSRRAWAPRESASFGNCSRKASCWPCSAVWLECFLDFGEARR